MLRRVLSDSGCGQLREIGVIRFLPFCVLLAGCATSVDVDATKMDLLQNTYELAHRTQWLSTASDEAIRGAITAKADAVCGPAGIAILDVSRPDYIRVPMSPRGYLHCR